MQQLIANRNNISAPLSFVGMDRAEFRNQTRRNALVKLRAGYKTVAAFADALGEGFSSSFVSQLLNGHRGIGDDVATKIEERLNLHPGHLDQHPANTEPGPDVRQFAPVISWVNAGEWSPAVDVFEPGYAEDWKPCPKNGKHTYALRVKGDSMTAPYGKSYPDGCTIFVDPEKRSPSNGQRIIAKLKGSDEVTFKTFQQDAGRVWLKPLNPQHPAIMEPFKVLGTVIGKWEDE